MFARLGSGFTATFPLPLPLCDSLQFPAVDFIWLCPTDTQMAEPTNSWPGYLTTGRRNWVFGTSTEAEGSHLAQAHSGICSQGV